MNGLWRFCQRARICRTNCSFRAITSQSSHRPRFHVSENIEISNMTTFLQNNHNGTHRWMSTKVEAPSAESLSQNTYEQVCSETLEALFEYFDNLIESTPSLKSADITYGDGVLTVKFGNSHGTYVINRQSPNKQIWLSSPKSGPKRYDFVRTHSDGGTVDGFWIYKHDDVPLHELLQNEITEIVGSQVSFLDLPFGKRK